MKKILVTHPSNDLYGADKILISALCALPNEAIKIVLLPGPGPLTFRIRNKVKNVHIHFITSLPIICRANYSFSGMLKLVGKYKRTKEIIQDLNQIHGFDFAIHNTLAMSLVARITKKLNIKSLMYCHEILQSPKIVSGLINKLGCNNSDSVICVSNAVRQNLVKHFYKVEKFQVIHNGIKEVKVGQNRIEDRMVFTFIGRISHQKGLWFLLDSLAQLPRSELIKLKINIVGGTVEGKEYLKYDLRKKIAKLGLQTQIFVRPFSPDISEILSKTNVVLVPSIMADPFPTTVIEAMSACRAVITTNNGGAQEIVSDGWNGKLVQPHDVSGLANAIKYYLSNQMEVLSHGYRGRHIYVKRLTETRYHSELQKFYAEEFDVSFEEQKLSGAA